jgi:hypothetical protein
MTGQHHHHHHRRKTRSVRSCGNLSVVVGGITAVLVFFVVLSQLNLFSNTIHEGGGEDGLRHYHHHYLMDNLDMHHPLQFDPQSELLPSLDVAVAAAAAAAPCTVGERRIDTGCTLDFRAPNGSTAAIVDYDVDPCTDYYVHANKRWLVESDREGGRFFGEARRRSRETKLSIEQSFTAAVAEPGGWQEEVQEVFQGCLASYGQASWQREAPAVAFLDTLMDNLWNTCFDSHNSVDLLCASGLWLRHGFTAPIRVDIMRSPRRAGERLLFIEPDGVLSGVGNGVATIRQRRKLIGTLLQTRSLKNIDNVIRIENELTRITQDAFAAASNDDDLITYVRDKGKGGLDAHIFTPTGAEMLKWSSLHRELVLGLDSDKELTARLRQTPHWAQSLQYLSALAKMQMRPGWIDYFVFTARFHTYEFLPVTNGISRSTLAPSPSPPSPTDNGTVHIGINNNVLLPWHPLWKPQWHKQELSIKSAQGALGAGPSAATSHCIHHVYLYMPEAIDIAFSRATLDTSDVARITGIVADVIDARKRMITVAPGISERGKVVLIEKLSAIGIRVGVPDNAEQLLHMGARHKITRNNPHVLNVIELKQRFMSKRFIMLLSSDTSDIFARREESFDMRTSVVNAYYNPLSNEITVLAAIAEFPFFFENYNDATLFATLGSVVGHEIGHATDKSGIMFDKDGVIRDWLPAHDIALFQQSDACFIAQYSLWDEKAGMRESGIQTVGEDAADNVGLHAALSAFKHRLGLRNNALLPAPQAYNFFLEFAQLWAVKQSPAHERKQLQTDPHAISRFRVNNGVVNSVDFLDLYKCKTRKPVCTLAA